jgi:hypothetical protein
MHWTYQNKEMTSLNDFPTNCVGFIYKITNILNGKIYVGKKILLTSRRSAISKREKLATATRKKFKVTVKESDWKTYFGSCQELKDDIKKHGEKNFVREILEFCHSKKYMTYCEVKYQFKYNVLETDTYNGNIMSKFFRKDLNEKI